MIFLTVLVNGIGQRPLGFRVLQVDTSRRTNCFLFLEYTDLLLPGVHRFAWREKVLDNRASKMKRRRGSEADLSEVSSIHFKVSGFQP